MNVVADESVEGGVVAQLRADGHDVVYVAELSPSISDDQVLRLAAQQDKVLLTGDKDFGELVFRLHQVHSGVVLIRLEGLATNTKASLVARVFLDHEQELMGSFTVVTPACVRIRRRELTDDG